MYNRVTRTLNDFVNSCCWGIREFSFDIFETIERQSFVLQTESQRRITMISDTESILEDGRNALISSCAWMLLLTFAFLAAAAYMGFQALTAALFIGFAMELVATCALLSAKLPR